MWTYFVIAILFTTIQVSHMDSNSLASVITKFSVKFCNELDKNRNVVSSPLSAELVLALLTLGTTDPAHSELLYSLGFDDDDSIRQSFSAISSKLKGFKGITLNVANKVYIQDGPYELDQRLKEDAVNIFDIAMEKVNFNDSLSVVSAINKWVRGKTNHKITELLSTDSIDSDTRVVLVNALYFKGTWKYKFDASNTMEQAFFLNENTSVQVAMMYRQDDYSYGYSEYLESQLLEIPYVRNEASMLIVLPLEIEGLDDVLKKLAVGYDLMTDVEHMFTNNVQITIPKFNIQTDIDLKELLPKLGINAIFNSDPGLTKIINSDVPLYVTTAVQKAFIEVNEEGAEAAAATGMALLLRRASPAFRADRPFLYLLLNSDRMPMFIGTYRGIV